LLIKYIKSVLWRVAKCLSYIEEARCLKVKRGFESHTETLPQYLHIALTAVSAVHIGKSGQYVLSVPHAV